MTSRRGFLLAAALSPAIVRAAKAPAFASDPFTLGIASGYPWPESVVIWTRLAPKPLEGGGMDPDVVDVGWEVAEDEAFKRIVRKGTAIADPVNAHAVHVEVDGLQAARGYFYRFHCGEAASPVGRTRTAPAPGVGDGRLRIFAEHLERRRLLRHGGKQLCRLQVRFAPCGRHGLGPHAG